MEYKYRRLIIQRMRYTFSIDHYSTEGRDENDGSELFTMVVHVK